MANSIRIMRSTAAPAPTGLAQGELAYVEKGGAGTGLLYIGTNGASQETIGGQFYVDLLNNYDTDLQTFALPASTTISVFGASIVDDADADAVLTTLGVDTDLTTLTIGASATVTGSNTGDVTLTAGTGTPSYLGLASQVLTFDQIDLTGTGNDVTGDLPFSNIAEIATDRFLGRNTAATGDIEVLTPATAKGMLDLTGTNSGDVTLVTTSHDYLSISGQAITLGPIDLTVTTGDVSGNLDVSHLNSGTSAGITTFWRGDGTWAVPAGGGDVTFVAPAPVDNAIARYDSTSGTLIQASGIVISDTTDDVTGMGTLNGKTIANLVSIDDTLNVGTWTWVLDEDNLGTDSATHLATQQSIKKYVDDAVVGGVTYIGSFDPTDTGGNGLPDLNEKTDSVQGDMYTVTVAGDYTFDANTDGKPNPVPLEVGDVLIAEASGQLDDTADWTIVQNNLDEASTTVPGYVNITTQSFGGVKTFEGVSGDDAAAILDSFVIDGGSF